MQNCLRVGSRIWNGRKRIIHGNVLTKASFIDQTEKKFIKNLHHVCVSLFFGRWDIMSVFRCSEGLENVKGFDYLSGFLESFTP